MKPKDPDVDTDKYYPSYQHFEHDFDRQCPCYACSREWSRQCDAVMYDAMEKDGSALLAGWKQNRK